MKDRLEAFEAMLQEIVSQTEEEKRRMDELKRRGKEKTATYPVKSPFFYKGSRIL